MAGIFPSTKIFSSENFVWAPTRGFGYCPNIAPPFKYLKKLRFFHSCKPKAPFGALSARVAGLEPVTSAVTGQRSNQLSYTRNFAIAFDDNSKNLRKMKLYPKSSKKNREHVLSFEINSWNGQIAPKQTIRSPYPAQG